MTGIREIIVLGQLPAIVFLVCINTKAVFTQRSLPDLTLDRSKVMSDKLCLYTLNRIATSDR